MSEDRVTLDKAADVLGITLAELRQLHADRLMPLIVSLGDGVPRFRRCDIERLPPNFEPIEEWSAERDEADGTQYVEA